LFFGISLYIKKIILPPKIIFYTAILQVLTCVFSFTQAINQEETRYEILKNCLYLFVFILSFNLFKKQIFTLKNLYHFSWIVSFILTISVLTQLINDYSGDIYVLTALNGHKNLAASFIFLLLIIKVSYLFSSSIIPKKVFYYFLILLDLGLIFILQSRGVWLALLVALFGFFIINSLKNKFKNSKYIVLSVLLLILLNVCIYFSIKIVIHKYEKEKTEFQFTKKEDQERVVLWKKTVQLIAEKPVFGHGGGNWQIAFPKTGLTEIWRAEDLNVTFQRPHNDFLWIICEYGIVGFEIIAFFTLLIFSYVLVFSDLKKHIIVIIVGLIGFYCFAFFDFPKERIEHSVLLFILLAYLLSNVERNDFHVQRKYNYPIKVFIFVSLFVILLFSIIRFNSEINVKKIHQSIAANQPQEIISEVHNASSLLCSIDSYSMPLHWYSATAYATTNHNAEVYSELRKAYQNAPYNRNVLNDLGTIYTLQGKTNKAISYFLKSHSISPRFDEPILNLAVIYINLGKIETAKYYMRQLKVDSPRKTEIEMVLKEY
jgi:O-antigen ligase